MRQQAVSMLKHFNTFSPLLKKLHILHCDTEFILFLIEILLNCLSGNIVVQSKDSLKPFKSLFRALTSDRNEDQISIKQKRNLLATNKGLLLLKKLYEPTIKHHGHL